MKYFFCPETMGLYPGGLSGAAEGKTSIELTEAQYRALAGQQLALDANGYPQLASAVPKAQSVDQLCSLIDTAADAARRTVAGDPLRAVEYERAAAEAQAFAAAYTEALYQIRETRLQAKELIRQAMAEGDSARAEDIAAETVAAIESAVHGVGNAGR